MKEKSYKYLLANAHDQAWGITVNTVGRQTIEPDYENYPPRTGHPDEYFFNMEDGRILDTYQLLYITEGKGRITVGNNKTYELTAGDAFILRPGQWHSYFPEKETGWKEYWIGFEGRNIDDRFRNGFFPKSQVVYKVGLRDDIIGLYEKGLDLAKKEKAYYQQYLAGIANLLLCITIYGDRNNTFATDDITSRINKAKVLIRENVNTESMSIEDIAREVNMSYSWFRKMFKEYTGFSPANYKQEIILQKAKSLLISSDMPIKEIAYMLNFESLPYFSLTFRKRTGMTPSEYRVRFNNN